MKRNLSLLVLAGSISCIGLLPLAIGQDADSEESVEDRLRRLERSVATLDTQLQLRTTAGVGAEDRTTRDFNLNARLTEIERRLQQMTNELTNLQRQASEATRAANQAQRDAQMAQQIARNAANRIR